MSKALIGLVIGLCMMLTAAAARAQEDCTDRSFSLGGPEVMSDTTFPPVQACLPAAQCANDAMRARAVMGDKQCQASFCRDCQGPRCPKRGFPTGFCEPEVNQRESTYNLVGCAVIPAPSVPMMCETDPTPEISVEGRETLTDVQRERG